MKLIIVFKDNVDEFDETKMEKEWMKDVFKDFHANKPRIFLPQKHGIDSVINADKITSISLIEEDTQ